MKSTAAELLEVLETSRKKLQAISEEESARPLAQGKWSPKEVLGHLIDSASNNHQRFVRCIIEDGVSLPNYLQDDWVRSQAYREEPWPELVALWGSYNLHLA